MFSIKKHLAQKLTALVTAAVLGASAVPMQANAGLKEAMNKMFVSASTDPQAINTQRLNGIYGGSMNLRPMSAGINIVQFAPPRIDAGCGGIDIFFGSFSFINSAQFEQLIRSIAANAVGFAIKAAIDKMCNPCGKLISELEAAMRELNSMAKNTCAIAYSMLPWGQDARTNLAERSRRIGTHLKNSVGAVSDFMKGLNNELGESPNESATGSGSGASSSAAAAVAQNNELNGNLVWRAAKETLNRGGNTLRAFMTEQEVIEIIMGLYGTAIYNPPKEGTCPPDSTEATCKNDPIITEPTITRFDQLMKPRNFYESGVPVIRCVNSTCTRVDSGGRIPLATWGGAEEFVNMALFGSKEQVGAAALTTPDSIVGMFHHKGAGGGGSFNAQARALVAITPTPIVALMMDVQRVPNGPMLLANQMSVLLPEYVAYYLASEIHGIGANVFSHQTTVSAPANYKENIKTKAEELNTMKPDPELILKTFNETTQTVLNIKTWSNSQYKTEQTGTSQ